MTRKEQASINRRLQFFRVSNRAGSHINCMRVNSNNTSLHENLKYALFRYLRGHGCQVLTEAIFEKGGVGDVVDLSNGVIYEVVVTEKEESIENKRFKYPECFEVRVVRSFDFEDEVKL